MDGAWNAGRDAIEAGGGRGRLRLAVISTPRSGNTWVRMQLASLYGLEQISAHFPDEIDWEHLPERCVLQIHWYPIADFVARLAAHGVRVIVLARHPMDVLMSWLNLVYYKHQDGVCKGQGACTECGIVGASPGSEAFVDYVRSYYGRVMLCYSPAWWDRPGILRARYEDLLAAPEIELGRLVTALGETPMRAITEVAAEHSLREMRTNPEVWRFHCWQGQSGLWRRLIPATAARAIRDGVPEPFDVLGYPCDPDETLEPLQAEYNWARVQLDSTRDHLTRTREKQLLAAHAASAAQKALEDARRALSDEQRAHDETRHVLAALWRPPVPAAPALNGWWDRVPGLSRWLRPSPPAAPFVPRPHYPGNAVVVPQSERRVEAETD
jgi:hypothetical protein